MNECDDCTNKECIGCKHNNRFTIQSICDEECILDKKTEEVYCDTDLKSICNLLNKLSR